jgi:hypothetical protein
MKTYTAQLFKAAYWTFSNGYAKLNNINFATLNRTLTD